MDPSRRKPLGGLIFALGIIAMLIGVMTDLYPATIGVTHFPQVNSKSESF